MDVTLNLAGLITILSSSVLPILVGLVTRAVTNSSVKATLLLLLTALGALFGQYLNDVAAHHAFNWTTAGIAAAVGYAVAVAVHFGYWVPTGATAKAQSHFVK